MPCTSYSTPHALAERQRLGEEYDRFTAARPRTLTAAGGWSRMPDLADHRLYAEFMMGYYGLLDRTPGHGS